MFQQLFTDKQKKANKEEAAGCWITDEGADVIAVQAGEMGGTGAAGNNRAIVWQRVTKLAA